MIVILIQKMTQKVSNFSRFKKWAYHHENGADPKYSTLFHSLFITLKGTLLFVLCSLSIRHYFFPSSAYPLQQKSSQIGIFLLSYLFAMITSRYIRHGAVAIYEALWACNQSILLAGIGCITGDAFLIRTVLVLVGLDQMLWYVDLIGYAVQGKFPVGVAKYITWPQTTKTQLATTFHHLWFLPLCMWIIHPTAQYTTFNSSVFLLFCIFNLLLCVIARFSAPKEITKKMKNGDDRVFYLNLNLSWELWKDVRIGFVQQMYKKVPKQLVLPVMSFVFDIANMPSFLILWAIESVAAK